MLPHYSMQQATEFGQTLCDAVRSMHLEHKGLSLGQLGVSIGVAMYPKPASNTESLVKMADKALYMAKDMGRSRVVNYDEYSRHKAPALEVADGEEVSTSLPKQ